MAGTGHRDEGHAAVDSEGGGADCSFVWDDESQLYYHAGSGFYHDPNARWYYSTSDGLYYRYENEHYVPWESGEKNEDHQLATTVSASGIQVRQGVDHCLAEDGVENPSPPSEWLEETLINLYLRGYSTEQISTACSSTLETEAGACNNHHGDIANDVEHDRNVMEDMEEQAESSVKFVGEDTSSHEENWLAQYGQVVKSEDEDLFAFPVVDLWDWRLVEECGKQTNKVSRLVGRLVKQSMQLHPSIPAGGGLLKTAPISEIHLDLVQVSTGKIYRLRSPSAEYLSSLLTYNSLNPTKDWGFPRLNIEYLLSHTATGSDPIEASNSILRCEGSSAGSRRTDIAFDKHSHTEYRDRAAERRALHGSFGIGQGEKKCSNYIIGNGDTFSESSNTEETLLEAGTIPFGVRNYGRRVLESMGWKEGEALGREKKGLLQPLQIAGNKGNAGLGWSTERKVL